jgi:hypothetical protein
VQVIESARASALWYTVLGSGSRVVPLSRVRRSGGVIMSGFRSRRCSASPAGKVVLIGVTLLVAAGCNGGGGGNAHSFTFELETAASSCYGASLHVDLTGLEPGPDLTNGTPCRLSEDAPPECVADFRQSGNSLDLAVRGCWLPDGSSPWQCDFQSNDSAQVATVADVACGCGCQESCPTAPTICAREEGEAACTAGNSARVDRTAAAALPAPAVRSESATLTVTTSTTCGTCCDYGDSGDFSIGTSEPLTELVIASGDTIAFAEDCSKDVYCDSLVTSSGPGYGRERNGEVEICVSDAEGIAGPLSIARCSVFVASVEPGPGRVIRALDRDFRPVATVSFVTVTATR